MSCKGGTTVEKRLSTSKVRKIFRKEHAFTIRAYPGPHKRKNSVPLGFVLRDLLKLCNNLKEAKILLNSGIVSVNGKTRKEYKFPVGLFDIVSVKEGKSHRATFDSAGRIEFRELDLKKSEKLSKVCKVLGKTLLKKNVVQISTDDGRIFRGVKGVSVGDSILIELPVQKIVSTIELKNGCIVFVSGGKHVGSIAKVKNIVDGTMKRPKLLALSDNEGNDFETTENNVIVVGLKKPEIEVLEF